MISFNAFADKCVDEKHALQPCLFHGNKNMENGFYAIKELKSVYYCKYSSLMEENKIGVNSSQRNRFGITLESTII